MALFGLKAMWNESILGKSCKDPCLDSVPAMDSVGLWGIGLFKDQYRDSFPRSFLDRAAHSIELQAHRGLSSLARI